MSDVTNESSTAWLTDLRMLRSRRRAAKQLEQDPLYRTDSFLSWRNAQLVRVQQDVALTGCNTTGLPSHAAP